MLWLPEGDDEHRRHIVQTSNDRPYSMHVSNHLVIGRSGRPGRLWTVARQNCIPYLLFSCGDWNWFPNSDTTYSIYVSRFIVHKVVFVMNIDVPFTLINQTKIVEGIPKFWCVHVCRHIRLLDSWALSRLALLAFTFISLLVHVVTLKSVFCTFNNTFVRVNAHIGNVYLFLIYVFIYMYARARLMNALTYELCLSSKTTSLNK